MVGEASGGRPIRLPFNVSESRETETGRFLTTFAGAGVHHIALGTDDIVAALDRAIARGAKFLPIPTNYYDDIAAKWGIDDQRIEMLKQYNLLYDRDEHGEFLHAYTETFDRRFFFEFVQRIGGYRQYGAANAAVRMAAQARARG